MNVLALDTSTDMASVALLRNGVVAAERSIPSRMNHAALLFAAFTTILDEAGMRLSVVQLCAAGIGPGSFSGIRIGLAALKGFRLVTNIPIVGVASTDALAEDAAQRLPPGCAQIAVVLDARREEWFVALYEATADGVRNVGDGALVDPRALPGKISRPTLLVGPDNERLQSSLVALPWSGDVVIEKVATYPRASIVGALGAAKFQAHGFENTPIEPIYLRQAVQMFTADGRK